MRTLLFLFFLAFFASCDNGHNISVPIEQKPVVEEYTKLDTNIVVPTSDDRISWQKPDEVIRLLGDLKGETVADIGAGGGYFAFKLARKAEKVIAEEIDTTMIRYMNAVAAGFSEDIQNRFETRLGTESDPNLAEDEVDNIIIINTLTYIDNKKEYLEGLKKGLKIGGTLMIVDFKMKRLAPALDAPDVSDRLAHYEVENLVTDAGFVITKSDDTTLDYQYIVVAQY